MKNLLILATAAVAASASAQVPMTLSTYFQNFDTLQNSGTGITWVNNLPAPGMVGWYSNQSTYSADNGSMTASGQYSYGSIAPSGVPSPERALGSIALPGALIVYGAQLNNTTGFVFGSLNVDYHGEQWRDGANGLNDVLQFEYSTNATSLLTGTWTPFSSLDFNSVSNVGAGPLDGNLPVNQAFMNQTITGLNWAPGTDLWIRWKHVGNASRHGLSIDEVHLTPAAVPEPATIAGLAMASAALIRRRRSKA